MLNPRKKISLRTVLIAACVIPLITSIRLVEYVAWSGEQAAVDQLVLDLQQRLGDRIEAHLQTYMALPPRAAGMMSQALERGELDPNRLDTWAPYLFDQGEFFNDLIYLYFGNATGDYIELIQAPGIDDQVIFTDSDRPHVEVFFDPNNPTQVLREDIVTPYDPRTRPWYQTGSQGKEQWTEIYQFINSEIVDARETVGFSFVHAYPLDLPPGQAPVAQAPAAQVPADQASQDSDTTLQGVGGADISLAAFAQFLSGLTIGKSGQAFVIDRDGKLLASSLEESLWDSTGQPLPVWEVQHPLVQSTGRHLLEQFGNFRQIQQAQSLSFSDRGQRQLVQVNPFQDDRGLDWLIVTVVPESDFTEQLRANARLTLILSLVVMGVAVLIAMAIAQRIINAMQELKLASQAIANGHLNQEISDFTTDEFHAVGQAFNQMKQQLAASFAHLEEKVADRTSQLQKQSEQLREKEQFLRTIYEGVEAAIFTINVEEGPDATADQRQFRCIDVSPAHSRMSRLSDEQILNKTPQQYLEPHAAELVTQEYQTCIQKRERVSYENRLEHEGRESWWLTTISPLANAEGQIHRLIVTGLNITQRKQAELRLAERTQELYETLEALKTTQEQLIESAKMAALGKLVAGVAHEVNTPVGTAILAASTLDSEMQALTESLVSLQEAVNLATTTPDYSEPDCSDISDIEECVELATECSQIITENLKRAGELIQSFKQIAVDQSRFNPRPFTLKPYIEEVIQSLSPQLSKTNLRVQVTGDDDLMLESDPGIVAQIVTNLVMNSLAHAYEPDQAGMIQLQVKSSSAELNLRYQDDGRGIAPELLDHIFDPFFTTGSLAENSGLGLHLVYNLVTQGLQGAIAVDSQLGQGTTFTLTLPAHPQPTSESNQSALGLPKNLV